MRFSPPNVICTVIIENEDTQVPQCRLSFAPETLRQRTIKCQKMLQFASFSHNISLRLPESATKIVISALQVSSEELLYTSFPYFHTRVRLCFWVLFWPFFHFLHFSGTTSALFLQTKARTVHCAPCASFLEPCSCCLPHVSRDSPGLGEHECSKPRETRKNSKMKIFLKSAIFLQKNT